MAKINNEYVGTYFVFGSHDMEKNSRKNFVKNPGFWNAYLNSGMPI